MNDFVPHTERVSRAGVSGSARLVKGGSRTRVIFFTPTVVSDGCNLYSLCSLKRLGGLCSKAMHSSLWHVGISSLVLLDLFVNGAAPLNQPFVPRIIIQPTNSTSLGRFSPFFDALIDETARGPPLPVLSCLGAGLLILGDHLAIESFTGRIRAQGWLSPHVAMVVSTQGVPSNSIERRFVIWGIFIALYQMRGRENFRSAIWTLRMYGAVVGFLNIHPRDLDTIDNRDSSLVRTEVDLTLSSIAGETNGSVTSDTNTLEAGRLDVIVSALVPPRPIDLYGVLLNFVGTIVEAAENPSSGVIRHRFTSNIEGSHIQVLISPGRHLTYKMLMKALTLIPSKLTDSRIQASFQADIYLGIVKVGKMQVLPGGS